MADQVISAYAEDVLPHVALEAAEELALAILDLAGQAGPARPEAGQYWEARHPLGVPGLPSSGSR